MRGPRDKTWTYILFLNKLNEKEIFLSAIKTLSSKEWECRQLGEQRMPFGGFSWKMFLFFSAIDGWDDPGALCLLGTPNAARLWTLHFQAFGGGLITKYFNARNSFTKPSQVSDLQAFKNILATARITLYSSIFRAPMFVLLEEKIETWKVCHEQVCSNK